MEPEKPDISTGDTLFTRAIRDTKIWPILAGFGITGVAALLIIFLVTHQVYQGIGSGAGDKTPTGIALHVTPHPHDTPGAVPTVPPTPTPFYYNPGGPIVPPTYTPYPTYTPQVPYPTYTPYPSPTPFPTPTPLPVIDFASGFIANGSMQLNNGAYLTGNSLRLTDQRSYYETRSAFYNQPVNITQFTTQFTYQATDAHADGATFTIQANTPQALGKCCYFLGYAGIPNSVAMKLDFWNPHTKTTTSATGVYTNGAAPDQPEILTAPLDLRSGDVMLVTLSYANATLTVTIIDTTTGASSTQTYTIDIAATIGSSYAYVGFTGSTWYYNATQDIQTWVFSN